MKKFNSLLLVLFLVLLSNCTTSNFTQTGETSYPEYEGPVEIFAGNPKDVVYIEVGIVTSKQSVGSDDIKMYKALLKKAAEHGANAIVLVSRRKTPEVKVEAGPYGFYGGPARTKQVTAIAIRIIDRI